jgi:hypothetical protein
MSTVYDDGEGSAAYPPMLSANCVQSVVTINPTLHHPKSSATSLPSDDLNKIRQNQFRNSATSQCSTTVAAHSSLSSGGNDESEFNTTLVATCNGRANGRIHLATIFEGPGESNSRDGISRVVRMKYSSTKDDDRANNPSFTTVCIASVPSRTSSAILALDTDGKLYANHFEVEESTGTDSNNILFDMELCSNNKRDGREQKSPKRGRKSKVPTSTQSDTGGHLLTNMNTLTARIESTPATDSKSHISEKSSQEPSSSTPKQKGRKRKATTPSKPDEGKVVYAVASSLNESHLLPSQTPPAVIRLTFENENDLNTSKLKGASWTKIPGLEHVHSPMTCIAFASRSSCGNQLWATFMSMMRYEERQDYVETNIGNVDEGIVLMGFQNGSLYAATVINGEPGHASKMLQLNSGEPFLSLQILRDEFAEPKLMCIGVLETLAMIHSDKNGAVKVDMKRLPFHGRLCSLACVGNHKHASNCTDLSLIATNDMGKTHFYQLSLNCKESNERKNGNLQLLNVFRLPISHGTASIGTKALEFVWSSSSGKVSLLRIASGLKIKRGTRSHHSLLAMLRQNGASQHSLLPNRTAQETSAVSKYEVVTQTLKTAIDTTKEKVDLRSSDDSREFQSNQATKEVRDAIRIVSLSSSNAPPPIQCTINASKAQGFDLGMRNDMLNVSSSWHHSIHTISSSLMRPESIKDMTPLCYRRARDGRLVKVLYGGSSASLNSQTNSSMHVSMNDFSPFSVYASLSKMFVNKTSAGNNAWEESVRFDAKLGMMKLTGQAKRAHMQGVVVPFKLGKKSSVALTGDVFLPFLKVANITRVKDVSEDVRSAAQKEVQQMVQGAGGRSGLLSKMLENSICYGRCNPSEKVHCSSNSVLLASSKNIERYTHDLIDNADVQPIALVLNSHKDTGLCELGFAIGSSFNNSNELMSMVPLMRHSIIRYSQREEDLRLDALQDEFYSRLLSEKMTAKIAKHVHKSASDILSRIDVTKSDTCPSALLTKCTSLYDIMRTLHFIIG